MIPGVRRSAVRPENDDAHPRLPHRLHGRRASGGCRNHGEQKDHASSLPAKAFGDLSHWSVSEPIQLARASVRFFRFSLNSRAMGSSEERTASFSSSVSWIWWISDFCHPACPGLFVAGSWLSVKFHSNPRSANG